MADVSHFKKAAVSAKEAEILLAGTNAPYLATITSDHFCQQYIFKANYSGKIQRGDNYADARRAPGLEQHVVGCAPLGNESMWVHVFFAYAL